jgi:hypothetical protein
MEIPEFVIESVGIRFYDSARAKIVGYVLLLSIKRSFCLT